MQEHRSAIRNNQYHIKGAAHPFVTASTDSGAQLTHAKQPVPIQERLSSILNKPYQLRSAARPFVTASTNSGTQLTHS